MRSSAGRFLVSHSRVIYECGNADGCCATSVSIYLMYGLILMGLFSARYPTDHVRVASRTKNRTKFRRN